MMSDQRVEASPLPSDSEDTALVGSSPPVQDTAPATLSPPAGPEITLSGPQSSVSESTAVQPEPEPEVPHQLQVPPALFADPHIHSPVSQPLPPAQTSVSHTPVDAVVSQTQPSVHPSVHSSPSRLHISVSVPQQQPRPTAACLSEGGEDSAVLQQSQNS